MAPSKTEDYRRALDAAIREYEELGRKRADIDQRLAQLAQSIGVLTRLCGFVPTVSLGLTDGCRLVLRGAGVPLTPLEVRDKLTAIGFDWSKYSNELASIHTVLKRLNRAGEIRLIPRSSGKHAYVRQHPATVVGVTGKHAYLWQHPPTASPLTKAEIDTLLEERNRRPDRSSAENPTSEPGEEVPAPSNFLVSGEMPDAGEKPAADEKASPLSETVSYRDETSVARKRSRSRKEKTSK